MKKSSFLIHFISWTIVLIFSLTLYPQESLAISESDVEGKSDEDLEEENWETRSKNAIPGSVRCGLWSILISSVWRGWGHHCAEDESSHYKLLIMEGASIFLMGTALTMGALSKDDKHLSPLWKSFFHFGATLFISSYLFDIIGTFKGNAISLSDNHLDPFGHNIDFAIRWAPSEQFNLGLQLDYRYKSKYFWVNPHAYLDLISLESWNVGLDTGVALWKGEKPYSYLALASDLKFEQYVKSKYDIISFLPYIEFSLDLGTWFVHLSNLRFVNRLGFGAVFYHFKNAPISAYSDHSTILVLETELSMNLFKDFNLSFIYRQRPDFSIGPYSAPSRLFNTVPVPGFGIFSLDLSFRISPTWLTTLEMNFGTSAEFWLSVSKRFE